MEGFKTQFSISEYSVSQTTLEQIFNTFAKEDEVGVSFSLFSISKNLERPQEDDGG